MKFEVLGPVRVRRGDRDVTPPGRLQRTLLGVLLLHADRVVSAAALADALWGELVEVSRASKLHLHVHRLRRTLGDADRLTFEAGGYRLAVQPGELDAEQFESLIGEAVQIGSRDPQRCVELIRGALSAWRGIPFDGLDVPLLVDEGRRLAERRMVAIEDLYTAELACGRHAAVAGELPGLVREHPLRERLHGLLMIALYRGGQQARALAAYQAARRTLVEELGQEPGPELRRIEQLILDGAPVEEGPAAGPTGIVPAQLPHDVRGFSGREAELSALDDLVSTEGPVLVSAVAGAGGVGKTALAVHWAHRVRDGFPDGQLYVDLRGYGPEAPMPSEEALAAFLRELGVDSAAIPVDVDERAARFRSIVAERRMVIVLDNARTADQVRPLLPGGSSCVVLVTSRDSLAGLVARDGAHRIVLDRLPHDDARHLLRRLVGDRVGTEPDAVGVLIERCARLPLALRIAAELINSRPRLRISELVDDLTDEHDALDVLDAGGDPHTAVRAVFSWSYQALAPDVARMFRLLGVHPGRDVDARALAALAGCRPHEIRRLMGALLRVHLADEPSPGRYQTHDLLRAYAAHLAERTDGDGERESALDRYFAYYLHTASIATAALVTNGLVPLPESPESPVVSAVAPAIVGHDDAVRWLNAERENLADGVGYATRHGRPQYTIQLSHILSHYLGMGGYVDDALTIHHAALAAAQAQSNPSAEANEYRHLGSVHFRLGHADLAWKHMYRAYECYQNIGDTRFVRLQLLNLGLASIWLTNAYHDAIRHLTEALRLYTEVGEDGDIGRVWALGHIGRAHLRLGNDDEALRYLDEGLDLAHRCGLTRKSEFYTALGVAHDRLGHHDQAMAYLEQARTVARETHDRIVEAAVFPLGFAYWRLGRRSDAFACMEHCLSVARSAGQRLQESEVLNALGRLHVLDGAPPDALTHHHAALDIAATIGFRHAQADAHAGIGDANDALGHPATARTHWQQALEIYRDLGTSEAGEIQERLDSLSPFDLRHPSQPAADKGSELAHHPDNRR